MPILGFTLRGVDCDPPRERALEVSVVATNGLWEHEAMKGVDCRTALVSRSVAAKPILRCQMSGFATLAIGVNIETPFYFP